jgi:hypothetical protein
VRAVFFDEVDQGYCGMWNSPQGGCAPLAPDVVAALQAANNVMIGRMATALNAAGLIPIFSMDNRLNASGAGLDIPMPCALPEDDTLAALSNATYARFSENWPSTFWAPDSPSLRAAMVESAILEGAAGVNLFLHSGADSCADVGRNITRPGRLGGPLEYAIASFLIVQTPTSVFSASDNW